MAVEHHKRKTGRDAGQRAERGPAEHRTRTQILEAAGKHFSQVGYAKTTVADLGLAIGVSPAYVYKFFDSKQAIGEAICAMTLTRMTRELQAVCDEPRSASERLRRLYRTLIAQGLKLYFSDRKLYDIISASIDQRWSPIEVYRGDMLDLVRRLVQRGRDAGEFERKTPLNDACTAIVATFTPFSHPVLLAQSARADLEGNAELVASLVLRSLAP